MPRAPVNRGKKTGNFVFPRTKRVQDKGVGCFVGWLLFCHPPLSLIRQYTFSRPECCYVYRYLSKRMAFYATVIQGGLENGVL